MLPLSGSRFPPIAQAFPTTCWRPGTPGATWTSTTKWPRSCRQCSRKISHSLLHRCQRQWLNPVRTTPAFDPATNSVETRSARPTLKPGRSSLLQYQIAPLFSAGSGQNVSLLCGDSTEIYRPVPIEQGNDDRNQEDEEERRPNLEAPLAAPKNEIVNQHNDDVGKRNAEELLHRGVERHAVSPEPFGNDGVQNDDDH